MAGRFLISGTQLGLIKSFVLMKETKEATKQLDDILNNQFVGVSHNTLQEDVEKWKEIPWEPDKP